jgi:hypothetical protein
MKRMFASSGLATIGLALAGLLAGGCGNVQVIKTSDAPEREDLFEDRMVTGSHIVYRVPKDKTIHPIHQPPVVVPADSVTVDIIDGPRQ